MRIAARPSDRSRGRGTMRPALGTGFPRRAGLRPRAPRQAGRHRRVPRQAGRRRRVQRQAGRRRRVQHHEAQRRPDPRRSVPRRSVHRPGPRQPRLDQRPETQRQARQRKLRRRARGPGVSSAESSSQLQGCIAKSRCATSNVRGSAAPRSMRAHRRQALGAAVLSVHPQARPAVAGRQRPRGAAEDPDLRFAHVRERARGSRCSRILRATGPSSITETTRIGPAQRAPG